MPAPGDGADRARPPVVPEAPSGARRVRRSPSAVQASLLRALDVSDGLLASWSSIHERALEPNPFFEPACVLAAARHLPRGDRIEVLVAHEGDTVLGCVPVQSLPRWHWSRRRTMTTRVRRLTWLGTPLLDREQADVAMTAMLGLLRDRRRSGDRMLAIEWMHASGPVAEVVRHAARRLGLPVATAERFERPAILRTAGAGDEGAEPLVPQRTTRKKRKKLSAQAGSLELVDRSGDVEALDEVLALEAKGYKGRDGIALTDWDGEPEWFKEMCTAFAEQGRVTVTFLMAGGRAVAAKVVVAADVHVFFCLTAYDEDYASYGPGILLTYDTVDLLARTRRFQRADTCTYAGNEGRREIFPDQIVVETLLVGLGSPVEHALLGALPAARRLRAGVRARLA